jgi:hypothetical protein
MKSKSEVLSRVYWIAFGAIIFLVATGTSFAQTAPAGPSGDEELETPGESAEATAEQASGKKDGEVSESSDGDSLDTELPSDAPPSVAGEPEMDGATYHIKLRNLEQKVDALKEQIRRSHTRLSLLSDTILSGASGGAKAVINFDNELSGAWRLVEAVFVLDGAIQYKKSDDTGILNAQREIPIFEGSIPSGDHTLQVMFTLKGQGFGVFSYMKGIEATVKSSRSFTLSEGKVLELKTTLWEKGGPTTPVDEQPSIRFDEQSSSMARGKGAASLLREKDDKKDGPAVSSADERD